MSTKATGNEPWTPVRLTETSVTERAAFRKCRRQWFLTIVHRLEGPGINENFWLGELVHAALEAYYLHDLASCGCGRRERCSHAAKAALDAYDAAANKAMAALRKDLGLLWEHAREDWEALDELGHEMVKGYIRFDREEGGLGEVESVEQRFRVRIPGTRGFMSLRIDLVTIREVLEKIRRTVTDHKSASSKPSEAMHDIDDQFTAYHWGYAAATGKRVHRVVRNVLLKRAARPPRLVGKGKQRRLSTDKRAPVTLELFLEAIRAEGFNKADYAEHLDYLAARGWQDFFVRQETIRTKGQLRQFVVNLREEWRDMVNVASHPIRAYPNPSPMHCPSCPVRDVCAAMMDERDVGGLIRSNYRIGDPRR